MAHERIEADFLLGAAQASQFPATGAPEVAMIGRSNVGKSSLINLLLRNGMVARVSSTPGKTQEINFFATSLGLTIADLPGYGYASVSKERRAEFATLINAYLERRKELRVTFVLVDARHDPMPLDMAMLEQLEFGGRRFVVVLTKCDKLSEREVAERVEQLRALLSACTNAVDVIPTSATTSMGREALIGIMKRSREFPEYLPV
ncbi:MAG: YihA family ribosome biogenesis GTP-binding protein [Candidatus Kapabacteria bacterium]|nr:YihA family ribosome biogenesis GTP-binding protein [Candidatus Kapabacteria bacterium]